MHLRPDSIEAVFVMESGVKASGTATAADISDAELLEFLIGYSSAAMPGNRSSSKTMNTGISDSSPEQYHKLEGVDHLGLDDGRRRSQQYHSLHQVSRRNHHQDADQHHQQFALLERWEPGEIIGDVDDRRGDFGHTRFLDDKEPSLDDAYMVSSPGADGSRSSPSPASTRRQSTTPRKRGPRPKQLTPQQKRQKRVDANDRERQRMGKLNSAFDSLRHLLPRHNNDRELSKFETIQIAKNYIRALDQLLAQTDPYLESTRGRGQMYVGCHLGSPSTSSPSS